MTTSGSVTRPKSIAPGARPPKDAERARMMEIVALLDEAAQKQDASAVGALLTVDAICELKPLGLRIDGRKAITEMFRRTLPGMSEAAAAREQAQIWANQNGIVREWLYPVRLGSGDSVATRQLEIIEFTSDLSAIASYRVRMNLLYAKLFERELGEDFAALPHVKRVPR